MVVGDYRHFQASRRPALLTLGEIVMRILTSLNVLISLIAVGYTALADDPSAAPTKAKLLITGLHCPPCTKTVQSSLSKVPGIKSISVDWVTKNALVEFDESVLPVQALTQRIATTPHMMGGGMQYGSWLALKVPALKDEASGKRAQAALAGAKGIKQAAVYPDKQAIGVLFSGDGKLTTQDVIELLAKADLEATGF
jgi:copper chaperone CopZ